MLTPFAGTKLGIASFKQASSAPTSYQPLLIKDVKISEAHDTSRGGGTRTLNGLWDIKTSQLVTSSAGSLSSLENALQAEAKKTTNAAVPTYLVSTRQAELTTITQGQTHRRHTIISSLDGHAQNHIFQPALSYRSRFFVNQDGLLQLDQNWLSIHKTLGKIPATDDDNAKWDLVPFCKGPHFNISLWANGKSLAQLSDGTLKATNWSLTSTYDNAKGIYRHDSANAAALYDGTASYQAQLSLLDYPDDILKPSYNGKLQLVVQMTMDGNRWFALVLSGATIARAVQANHQATNLLETKIQLSASYPTATLAAYFGVQKDDKI